MSSLVQIQIRRDTSSNWVTANPVLASGEMGYETDTGKLKFGDGASSWSTLPYFNEGDKNKTFTQALPATQWVVPHGLVKRPSVSVFDSAGTHYIGQVTHIDDNNLIIDFNHALSGKAYLN